MKKKLLSCISMVTAFSVLVCGLSVSAFAKNPNEKKINIWDNSSGQRAPIVSNNPILSDLSSDNNIEYTLDFADLDHQVIKVNGVQYDSLTIPGCGLYAEKDGYPELPFKGFFVEVPGSGPVSVEVLDKSEEVLGKSYNIYPKQKTTTESEKSEFYINQDGYKKSKSYPQNPVLIDSEGVIRGTRVVLVKVFPLSYNPSNKKVSAISSIKFRITSSKLTDEQKSKYNEKKAKAYSNNFDSISQNIISNYQQVGTVDTTQNLDATNVTGARYLMIVKDSLYEEALPLADWKKRKGFQTKVTKLSEIGSTTTDIKSYIQNAFNTWSPMPEYVLFVGDHQDIPAEYYSNYSCYSDHGYSCVDGTDFFPDLTIGRLPVTTEDECTTVVDKILSYDMSPQPDTWYDDFLTASYFQTNSSSNTADNWYLETSSNIANYLSNTVGLTGHYAWSNEGNFTSYNWNSSTYPHRFAVTNPVPSWITEKFTTEDTATANITSAINSGVSIAIHRDHGSQTSWSIPNYTVSNINALTNGSKQPIVFSLNCSTGSFQRTGGDSFCEAFLKKSNGGSVGCIGATRTTYTSRNDSMANGIFTCFWPSYDSTYVNRSYSNNKRPANALNFGKYYMNLYFGGDVYTQSNIYAYHYFGDPEMMMRTKSPVTINATYSSSIYIGQQTFQVNTGVANALVCLYKGDEVYARGFTNSTGVFSASINPTTAGTMYVTVTGEDLNPHKGSVTVKLQGSWTSKTAMPSPRTSQSSAVVNNIVYSIGGIDSTLAVTNTVQTYNPSTNIWSTKANLITARKDAGAAELWGNIYVAGGFGNSFLNSMEMYNPASNTWTTKANMPTARHSFELVEANGKLYAIGGINSGGTTIGTVEEYNPTTNTWSTKASMPTARRDMAAVTVNGKIYVIGGVLSNNISCNTVEEYNPATNTWSAKATMPTVRRELSAGVINGKIYAIGGFAPGVGTINKVEEYNPLTNAWTEMTSMITARESLTTSTVNQKIYAIGGINNTTVLNKVEEFTP
ncbi:C25 family cysteine peptidase [Pseudobacteroides cellulosolvens]|uniref:Gingipain R n=1 Tax=Pseudobacteroides cellulosolvens ATCC 35603 = DSM 2933 TaxID=398512 RepID=A0A0L6JHE3_9FIRM|nr:C25 family cysteine peptidase [Pseudobacteroides cellulosolvens]KNY25256.1 Gingipain R [Pseudobacteroides cellulosolvens ATCC 35603 = DSM 2933]